MPKPQTLRAPLIAMAACSFASACDLTVPIVRGVDDPAGAGKSGAATHSAGAAGASGANAGAAGNSAAGSTGTNIYSVRGKVALRNGLSAQAEYNQIVQGPCDGLFVAAKNLGGTIEIYEGPSAGNWRCGTPGFFFGEAVGSELPFKPGKRTFRLVPPSGFACSDQFEILPKGLDAILDATKCALTVELQTPVNLELTFFVDSQPGAPSYELNVAVNRRHVLGTDQPQNRFSKLHCSEAFLELPEMEAVVGDTRAAWHCEELSGARFGEAPDFKLPFSPGKKRVFLKVPAGYQCVGTTIYGDGAIKELSPLRPLECFVDVEISGTGQTLVWFEVEPPWKDSGGFFRATGHILRNDAEGDAKWLSATQCATGDFVVDKNIAATLQLNDSEPIPATFRCPTATEAEDAGPSFAFGSPGNTGLDFSPGTRTLRITVPKSYECLEQGTHMYPGYVMTKLPETFQTTPGGVELRTCAYSFTQNERTEIVMFPLVRDGS